MSLVKCHECGKEISSEAKICPQCGAKNKFRKQSKIVIYGGSFLILFVLFGLYKIYINPSIPPCNSKLAHTVFKDMLEKTPWAIENHIKAIEVINVKNVGSEERDIKQICEVTLRLSDTSKKTYIYKFREKKDGGYFVRIEPK